MTAYGVTTMHLFDESYLSEDLRRIIELKHSGGGWLTTVDYWASSMFAVGQANAFLKDVEFFIQGQYASTSLSVDVSPTQELIGGVKMYEKTLMGVVNGVYKVLAKARIAWGEEEQMDRWDLSERKQWFGPDYARF